MQHWQNWTGNQSDYIDTIHKPNNEDEVIAIIKQAKKKGQSVRVCGRGYSYTSLISNADVLISLDNYQNIVGQDLEKQTITCQAGCSIHDLAEHAARLGFSLPSISNLAMGTVGGAVATSTHGAGKTHPILAQHMIACRLINANGEIVELNAEDEDINAVRAGLGLCGFVSTLTFQCEPKFSIESKHCIMSDNEWIPQFRELNNKHEFLMLIWFPYAEKACVMKRDRTENINSLSITNSRWWDMFSEDVLSYSGMLTSQLKQVSALSSKIFQKCFFRDMTIKGPMHQVLTKQLKEKSYSCEYGFTLDDMLETVNDIKAKLKSKTFVFPGFLVIHPIAADSAYLSVAHDRETVGISGVIYSKQDKVPDEIFDLEKILLEHNGYPHLAKVFSEGKVNLNKVFPQFDKFVETVKRFDPDGMFMTNKLKSMLGL